MDRTDSTHHLSGQTLHRKLSFAWDSLLMSARLIAAVFGLCLASSATAAVVEINGNQIQTDGALNATVDYTAEKLSINIPGVTIIIDCGPAVPTESCTLTTGASDVDQPALTPTLGSPSPMDGGFTVQVSNYSGAYSWSAASSTGSASIDGAGLVTVSGLTSGQSATVTVTTTRSGYATGSASVTGVAKTADPNLGAELVPLLGTPTSTTDGFTIPVTNFNDAYNWSVSVTDNIGSATIDGSGVVTVSGLSAGQSATVRVFTSRSGYKDGAAEKTGSALPEPAECKPGMDCYETCAPENRPTDDGSSAQADWDQACANYDPTINNPVDDPEPAECMPGMDCYETCAPENRPTNNLDEQAKWDQACANYDPTINNPDGGPDNDECPGVGYDCYEPPVDNSGDGADPVVERDAFPIGSARVVERAADEQGRNFDFGSAGINGGGGRVYWTVEKGVVSVAGLTLTEDEGSEVIRLSFGVTADQPTAALHYWISEDPDGDSIQGCSYVGYAQTSQKVAIDDSENCQLKRGGEYFVNLALCDSEEGDIECRSAQALSAERAAVLAVRSSLIDR